MKCESIDIFCHCIDNYGDAGVTYRFARELKAARPSLRVRVFIDDMAVLGGIAGGVDPATAVQEYGGVVYIDTNSVTADTVGVADVMVEMFACHIPGPLMELAYDHSKLIVNLEYLSAEGWVEEYHLKESLLGRGTVRKFYFMPGFREATGGLIVNSALERMRGALGIDLSRGSGAAVGNKADNNGGDPCNGALVGTVFTYERGFDNLLADLGDFGRETTLLVFGDKSGRGMEASIRRAGRPENVRAVYMPFIDQHGYDTLLCCADFNIVRGEDSLARAVLSGKPFIWNAYIQDEKYHRVKVEALLKTMRPFYDNAEIFADYSRLMLDFNDVSQESTDRMTSEHYGNFFKNLKKHEHSARAMYYFMIRNCNLIDKFVGFLDDYDESK